MKRHLYLIGYRGSGKSTVGHLLAHQIERPLIDTDHRVVETEGRSIAEIFAREGEEAFRAAESRAIEAAAAGPPAVVSLGGGAILWASNTAVVSATGWCVYLAASPRTLASRIEADPLTAGQRPSLTGGGVTDEVAVVLKQRDPIYRRVADAVVAVDHRTPGEVAATVADLWRSFESSRG